MPNGMDYKGARNRDTVAKFEPVEIVLEDCGNFDLPNGSRAIELTKVLGRLKDIQRDLSAASMDGVKITQIKVSFKKFLSNIRKYGTKIQTGQDTLALNNYLKLHNLSLEGVDEANFERFVKSELYKMYTEIYRISDIIAKERELSIEEKLLLARDELRFQFEIYKTEEMPQNKLPTSIVKRVSNFRVKVQDLPNSETTDQILQDLDFLDVELDEIDKKIRQSRIPEKQEPLTPVEHILNLISKSNRSIIEYQGGSQWNSIMDLERQCSTIKNLFSKLPEGEQNELLDIQIQSLDQNIIKLTKDYHNDKFESFRSSIPAFIPNIDISNFNISVDVQLFKLRTAAKTRPHLESFFNELKQKYAVLKIKTTR
jgi:hypothetical protein